MHAFLFALAAAPALAWESRFGTVPGNDYGRPGNASFDYVIVGGGKLRSAHLCRKHQCS